jgi:RNA polymerase sigma-70 factor, ECF subfamily
MDGTDEAAVARVRQGDADAFRIVVDRHGRAIFRLAFRLTGNEHDAEEVVQDAFLKAYTQIDQYESRAAFSTWLHRIAVNCAMDLLRRRRGHDMPGEDPHAALEHLAAAGPGPERRASGREIRDSVARAMQDLTPLERAAFTLRHLEQRSIREVCDLLGVEAAAARHSIFRAVAKMRRTLAPLVR